MKIYGRLLFFILTLALTGCVSNHSSLSYYHPRLEAREMRPLLDQAKEIEKEDFENIKLVTLADNEFSSHHLVIIKKEEKLHYHAKHDAWAFVLKGKADFWLGEKRMTLKAGDSVFIPRGMHHQAVRKSKEALAAFVIFTPAFDGKDTIPVENPKL